MKKTAIDIAASFPGMVSYTDLKRMPLSEVQLIQKEQEAISKMIEQNSRNKSGR